VADVVRGADLELKVKILAMLDENSVMSIATLRPDGWPQATMVGYVRDDLTLYFAIGRKSQKFANLKRDSRVSIALGRDSRDHIRGLSMAARVSQVMDIEEVVRVNALLADRYPKQVPFAPRETSSALMRAAPRLISVIDLEKGPGQPELVQVTSEGAIHPVGSAAPP
jgi:uncharacterized pyridoxamine 5'-phosphate oxidase family protein